MPLSISFPNLGISEFWPEVISTQKYQIPRQSKPTIQIWPILVGIKRELFLVSEEKNKHKNRAPPKMVSTILQVLKRISLIHHSPNPSQVDGLQYHGIQSQYNIEIKAEKSTPPPFDINLEETYT